MEPEEVRELLQRMRAATVEWTHLDAKLATRGVPKNLPETLSAMSNTVRGGIVLLGVGNGPLFHVEGINDPTRVVDQLVTMCREELVPAIRAQINTVPVEKKRIVTVEVPEAGTQEKPVYIKERGQYHGAFIRCGEGDRHLSEYEIIKMLENRGQPRHDAAPVAEANRGDLSAKRVQDFVEALRSRSSGPVAQGDEESILRSSRVLVESDAGIVPSLAGLMVFGRNPQEFFPNLRVVFMVHPDTDPKELGPNGERYLVNESFEGPIPDMLDRTLKALQREIRRGIRVTGAAEREELPEYPAVAMREAAANALLHRDYAPQAQGSQVTVSLFPDRLTISNPGGLFGTVTIENIMDCDIQQARNEVLMRIAEDLRLVENRGGGVGAIAKALRDSNLAPPQFDSSPSRFRVTFRRHHLVDNDARAWPILASMKSLPEGTDKLYAYIRDKQPASYRMLLEHREEFELNADQIRYRLKRLVAKGLIRSTEEKSRSPLQSYVLVEQPGGGTGGG